MWTLINSAKNLCTGIFPTYESAVTYVTNRPSLLLEPIELQVSDAQEDGPVATLPFQTVKPVQPRAGLTIN